MVMRLLDSSLLISVIDRWIPEQISKQEHLKLRARSILLIMAMCSASVALIFVTLTLSALFSDKPLWDGIFASFAVSLTWYGGIVFLRKTARLSATCHVFSFIMYSSTMGALLTSGGWESPAISLLLAVPVGIFLVAGRQIGLIWSAVAAVSYYVLWLLHEKNVVLMQIVRPEHMDNLMVGIWCFSCLIMIGCMVVYDGMAEVLRTTVRSEREHYRHQLLYDSLTGIYNRRGIEEHLHELLMRKGCGEGLLLLNFNMENLSLINSEMDYQAGDELIAEIAKRCQSGVSDMPDAACGRTAAGEFVLLIPRLSCAMEAEQFAKRMSQVILKPYRITDREKQLEVRGGVGGVFRSVGAIEIRAMFREAMEAMQEAKDSQLDFVVRQYA